jgi:formylglycine-generating enzyme required for sulfatase activity/energy-coupling factor transporter ATP-binding protein EcfA2
MSIDNVRRRSTRSFERDYLQALVNRFNATPALLVKQDSSRRDLKLLEAYCPLTLNPDRDDAEFGRAMPTNGEQAIVSAGRPAEVSARPLERVGRRAQLSFGQRVAALLLRGLIQLMLLALVAILSIWLLWVPVSAGQIAWPRIGGAVVVLVIWLFAAYWLHKQLVGRETFESFLTWQANRNRCLAQPGTPGAEIWDHQRLLVRGEPGSGKTTLLRHMAVICARDRLGEAQRQNQDRVRDVYGWPIPLFPIYVPLRALTFSTAQDNRPFLERYTAILPRLFNSELPGCDLSFFVRRVNRGGCLILIDAFDELPSQAARDQYSQLIASLARIRSRKPNRIVVTSRIVGYEGQLDAAAFVRRRVAELDDDQITEFITGRYTAIMAPEPDSQSGLPNVERMADEARLRATDLIARLPENPGLQRMSRNPLLLALAVGVHHEQRNTAISTALPQERIWLYEEALKLLVNDWERRKDADIGQTEPRSEFGNQPAEVKLRLLGELAWAMFESASESGDDHSHAVTMRASAHKKIVDTLLDTSFASEKAGKIGEERKNYCQAEVDGVLERINQSGVLQERGIVPGTSDAQIQFAHLTFQEYLAARAADSEQQVRRRKRLLDRWNDPRLREVLVMYAARSDATPVIKHLLAQGSLEGTLMAGAILNERPRKVAPEQLTDTMLALHTIALEDDQIDASTAMSALRILYPLLEKDRPSLIEALASARHPEVRTQLVGLLSGLKCNRFGVPVESIIAQYSGRVFLAPNSRPQPALFEPDIQEALLQVLSREQDYRPRVAAGFALARGDPRYEGDGWNPELVEVSAGTFLMGSDSTDILADRDEKPQHTVEIPYTYWIGRTPVTVAQWRRFAEMGGYETERYWTRAGWHFITNQPEGDADERAPLTRFFPRAPRRLGAYRWTELQPGYDNLPISNISWFEAVAYCRWLSEATKQLFYLPNEAEWEKAARGPNGLIYPWGHEWQKGCCNSNEAGIACTSPAGSFPTGASPYGALDLAGNVHEWCATKYRKAYPYALEEEWSEEYLDGTAQRMTRGGSYTDDNRGVRGAYRYHYRPDSRSDEVGLRVASRSSSY